MLDYASVVSSLIADHSAKLEDAPAGHLASAITACTWVDLPTRVDLLTKLKPSEAVASMDFPDADVYVKQCFAQLGPSDVAQEAAAKWIERTLPDAASVLDVLGDCFVLPGLTDRFLSALSRWAETEPAPQREALISGLLAIERPNLPNGSVWSPLRLSSFPASSLADILGARAVAATTTSNVEGILEVISRANVTTADGLTSIWRIPLTNILDNDNLDVESLRAVLDLLPRLFKPFPERLRAEVKERLRRLQSDKPDLDGTVESTRKALFPKTKWPGFSKD